MALILNLETSTKNCSVALAENGQVLSLIEESSDQYIHSEKLHNFIEKALKQAGKTADQLEAVAVGKGPGSYTGLRIGVSAAKGFCFALDVPLISEDGLQILVSDFVKNQKVARGEFIISMLDARRMEVYCSVFDHMGKRLSDIEARIIDENSFADLEAPRIHLMGDGAAKCREILSAKRFVVHSLEFPSASALAPIAAQKFEQGQFEDVAYFEPFYLKDFVAGKPKPLL